MYHVSDSNAKFSFVALVSMLTDYVRLLVSYILRRVAIRSLYFKWQNVIACWRVNSAESESLPFVTNYHCIVCFRKVHFKPLDTEGGAHAEPDGTHAETRFRLAPKRTSPFKSAEESVQSTAGSRGVYISVSNAGYTTFRGRVRVLATHSIREFPLHFPSRASPCATTFRTQYTQTHRTRLEYRNVPIFRCVRLIANSDSYLRYVCPSVRIEQLSSYWTDFH